MINTETLTIAATHAHLTNGDFSVKELAAAYESTIEKKNPDINAVIEVYDDIAAQTKAAQQRFSDKTATVLTGVPLAIKDNILIAGKKVTSASKILTDYVAPYTATATQRLADQGAVFLARANMDEFAMGASTETSYYGVTKNPHDLSRVAGGTSGGSTAAVAMGGVLAALGSDTGGSIRQPASFCGVVGLKPTYGAVSRYGLMSMTSSLDQIGPITKTIDDTEVLFDALTGKDPHDATSVDYEKVKQSRAAKTIGVPRAFLEKGIDPDVQVLFEATLKKLADEGYIIRDIDLPLLPYSVPTYYIIVPAEVSSNLARYDGMKYGLNVPGDNLLGDYLNTRTEGFGREVKRRIMIGTYVLSAGYYDAYYGKAQVVRAQLRQQYIDAFSQVDVIALPTAPSPAFKIGEKSDDPIAMYLSDIFTAAANLAGICGVSVPMGTVVRDGVQLPVGFQLQGPHFGEHRLFDIGRVIERVRK